MKIGYIRVSTQEQNTMRQEVLMEALGVDEVYIDRMSGKNTNRPELQKMMEYVRKGDTVIVESISRFARNTRDLLELVEQLTAKGVEFVSKKEAIDTTELEYDRVCHNPKCISQTEQELPQIFRCTDKAANIHRCIYCEQRA